MVSVFIRNAILFLVLLILSIFSNTVKNHAHQPVSSYTIQKALGGDSFPLFISRLNCSLAHAFHRHSKNVRHRSPPVSTIGWLQQRRHFTA